MAKEDKEKKEERAAEPQEKKPDPGKEKDVAGKKPGRGFKKRITQFLFLLAAVVFYPTTLVFLVGMIPTALAASWDKSPGKSAGLTVGAMNLAGVIVPLLKLWGGSHTLQGAVKVLGDPSNIIIMYAGALAGWIIYDNITPLVAMAVRRKTEYRLRDIERRQAELRSLWGDEVTGDAR